MQQSVRLAEQKGVNMNLSHIMKPIYMTENEQAIKHGNVRIPLQYKF